MAPHTQHEPAPPEAHDRREACDETSMVDGIAVLLAVARYRGGGARMAWLMPPGLVIRCLHRKVQGRDKEEEPRNGLAQTRPLRLRSRGVTVGDRGRALGHLWLDWGACLHSLGDDALLAPD
jgi:hypothetical protein